MNAQITSCIHAFDVQIKGLLGRGEGRGLLHPALRQSCDNLESLDKQRKRNESHVDIWFAKLFVCAGMIQSRVIGEIN